MKIISKTILSATLVLLCCTSLAYGQSDRNDDASRAANTNHGYALHAGVKLGLALANQSSGEPRIGSEFDYSYKPGFTWGAVARVAIVAEPAWAPSITLGVQSEVLFVPKGLNVARDGESRGGFQFDYIEIPLLARTSIAATPTIEPYFLLGPALGILSSVEFVDSLGNRTDLKSTYTNTDVGLVIGAGTSVDIPAIRGAVTLDARYNLGLRDINATGMGGFVKNRVFAFTLAYEYQIR